jgi:hypothetical protein
MINVVQEMVKTSRHMHLCFVSRGFWCNRFVPLNVAARVALNMAWWVIW